MLTVNAELSTILSGVSSKTGWCAAVQTALGSSRRVICTHNGVVFRNCALTGSMTSSNGAITGLGTTSGTTVALGRDLSSGSATLRIEGNGNWVEGSLGLSGSGCDFIFDEPPTANNGIAITTLSIGAPSWLPMYPPAAFESDAPYSVTHVDYSSGSAGATQTIYFDEDAPGIVWDDAERTADLGTTPYRRSTQIIVNGSGSDAMAMGIHLFAIPARFNDEDSTKMVYQVLVPMKPHGRWSTYPAMDTYNPDTDNTFIQPCKLIIKNQAGVTLHTIEMHRDGKPINDPSLGQTRNASTVFRPFVHCKMMLHWTSARLKESTKARKYYPGTIAAYGMRPKMARGMTSANSAFPMFPLERQQVNGFNHYFAMPAWSMTTASTLTDDPVTDPNLPANIDTSDPSGNSTDGARKPTRAVGYMYEPGSPSGHDWYPSPGGVRFDRYFVPSALTMYMTQPTGSRPQGNVPHRVLADEWGKAYFNHGHHDITDARTLGTIPNEQAAFGQWAYAYGYYTPQGPVFVDGGESRHIDTKTIMNGETWGPTDKNGRHHYNGWNVDDQHNYSQPGWWALQFNSVIHAISAKLRFNAEWMAAATNSSPTANATDEYEGYFLRRQHAWRYLHLAMMWKLGTSHSIGISRAMVEDRWEQELNSLYTQVTNPATNPAHPSYNHEFFKALRVFGVPGLRTESGANHYISPFTDSKLLYMSGVLAFMKQTGSWDAMRAKSANCAATLDLILQSVGKYSVTQILATQGRAEPGPLGASVPIGNALPLPASWTEWAATYAPVSGSKDLITNTNGTPYDSGNGPERSSYQHLLIQTVFMFRDYFADVNFPGVSEACTLCQGFEDTLAARVIAGTSQDYTYRHPAAGPLAVPSA